MTAFCVLCGWAVADVLVLTADRAERAAELRVDASGQIRLMSTDGTVAGTLKRDGVWLMRFDVPQRFQTPGAWLCLRDGRCFRGERIAVRHDTLSLEGSRPLAQAPIGDVAAVFFRASRPAIGSPPDRGVRIISANGDVMPAPAVELTPAGAVVDINPDVDPVLFPTERLSGVVFSGIRPRTTGWLIELRTGQRWIGPQLTIDADRVSLIGEGAGQDAPLREVSEIVRLPRRLRPLEEVISPEQLRKTHPAARLGCNYLGAPLRIAERFYGSGAGLRDGTTLPVPVPEQARWFIANVGADADGSPASRMVFRIACDGDTVLTTPAVSPGDAAIPVAVSVEGRKQLVIHLDPAEKSPGCMGDVVDAVFVD